MKILRENMRRFNTKNLNEQLSPAGVDELIIMYKQLSDTQKEAIKSAVAINDIAIYLDKHENKDISYDSLTKALVNYDTDILNKFVYQVRDMMKGK